MTHSVLVVDDDPAILDLVQDALGLAGFVTTPASDGLEALNLLRDQKYDLVVADINMPKLDGLELLGMLRERGNLVPFVFLTARNQKVDLSQGFRSGADDFITKPFSIEELVLRVNAVLRRVISTEPKVLSFGRLTINPEQFRVEVEGQQVELSPTEFRLLLTLAQHSPGVCSKALLLDEVWGLGFSSSVSVVDTYISYLRKRLHKFDFDGIKTLRGFGFRLDAQ